MREDVERLIMAAGALNVATDGMEALRQERTAVLEAMEALRTPPEPSPAVTGDVERCTCVNVAMGSYANQEVRDFPFADRGYQRAGPVGIDRCILPTIEMLWSLGIETIESCCGHGKAPGYIAVIPHHHKPMLFLGFEPHPDNPAKGFFVWPRKTAALLTSERNKRLEEALVEIEAFRPVEGEVSPYVQIATFAKRRARAALSPPTSEEVQS